MTERSVTVTIPGTPAACLSLNGRAHWRVKAKHAREYRITAQWAGVAARGTCGGGPILRGAVQVHYVFAWEKGRKRMDFDNLVGLGKPALDGLVDAGIIGDDREVVAMSAEQTRDPSGRGYLEVTITAAGEGVKA